VSLDQGSIVFEARVAAEGRPHVLCGFDQSWPRQRSITFRAVPGGGISLVQITGEQFAHAAVQHGTSARIDRLRVTFSWDCTRGHGMLSVERPEVREVTSTPVSDVQPVALSDLQDFILARGVQTFSDDMVFAAISDSVEPVGPCPSLAPGTPVEVANGYQEASLLRRGDLVRTQSGDLVPVLHRIDRVVPARGSFAPLRLRAPYFGLLDDVVVACGQRLMIDGSEVEYLFDKPAVLAPARHLVNGFAAREEATGPTVRYTQVILPGHEAITVCGTAMESLYIGRLRRKRDEIGNTLLRDIDRNTLPEHGRPAYPELKWYDAIHLARQRVA
jgi:hypothetical protein